MLYLLLAITSSVLISIIMRISERYVKNEMGMFMANYAVCMLLSFLYMPDKSSMLFQGAGDAITLVLGVLSGILYLISFVFMKKNMAKNGIIMTSTFMRLGVLVPTVMAVVVFREMPSITQIAGVLFAIIGILVMYFEKQALKGSGNKLWLIALLMLSGLTDSMANIFDKVGTVLYKDVYLLLTFVIAFLIAGVFTFRGKNQVKGKDIIVGALIGIPNYYSARFLLLALGQIQAVLVYPMYSVSTIIVTTVVGIIVFHEEVGRKKLYALAVILLAMVLLNL